MSSPPLTPSANTFTAPPHTMPLRSIPVADIEALNAGFSEALHLATHAQLDRFRVVKIAVCLNEDWRGALKNDKTKAAFRSWIWLVRQRLTIPVDVFLTPGISGVELRCHWLPWNAPTPSLDELNFLPVSSSPTTLKGEPAMKLPFFQNKRSASDTPPAQHRDPEPDFVSKPPGSTGGAPTVAANLPEALKLVARRIEKDQLQDLRQLDMNWRYHIDVLTFFVIPASLATLKNLMEINQRRPDHAKMILEKSFQQANQGGNTLLVLDRCVLEFQATDAIPKDATDILFATDTVPMNKLFFKVEGSPQMLEIDAPSTKQPKPAQGGTARPQTCFYEPLSPSRPDDVVPTHNKVPTCLCCTYVHDSTIHQLVIDEGPFVIGREADGLDLELSLSYVSGKHLTFTRDPMTGGWFVTDSSRFGSTLVTIAEKVNPESALRKNKLTQLGRDKLTKLPAFGMIRLGPKEGCLPIHFHIMTKNDLEQAQANTPTALLEPKAKQRNSTAF